MYEFWCEIAESAIWFLQLSIVVAFVFVTLKVPFVSPKGKEIWLFNFFFIGYLKHSGKSGIKMFYFLFLFEFKLRVYYKIIIASDSRKQGIGCSWVQSTGLGLTGTAPWPPAGTRRSVLGGG